MKGDAAALVDALVDGCGVVDGDAAAHRNAGLTAAVAGGGEGGRGKREICRQACNIPNFQFGMLYITSSCISYFLAFC